LVGQRVGQKCYLQKFSQGVLLLQFARNTTEPGTLSYGFGRKVPTSTRDGPKGFNSFEHKGVRLFLKPHTSVYMKKQPTQLAGEQGCSGRTVQRVIYVATQSGAPNHIGEPPANKYWEAHRGCSQTKRRTEPIWGQ